MTEEGNQHEWLNVESVDTFAVGQSNLSKGKCGWDAARLALIDIGMLDKGSGLLDYKNRLVEFAKEYESEFSYAKSNRGRVQKGFLKRLIDEKKKEFSVKQSFQNAQFILVFTEVHYRVSIVD